MTHDKLLLLKEGLQHLDQAATHLAFSQARTKNLIHSDNWTPEELERLESLSSRFARLSDILTQKIMRLIDDLELTPGGTLLDRVQRAEKRGWVESASDLIRIRELRNLIAHEYAADKMAEIYQAVGLLAPKLLETIVTVRGYAERLAQQYADVTKGK